MKNSPERDPAERGERSDRDTPERSSAGGFLSGNPSLEGLGNRALLTLLRSGRLQRKARASQPADPAEHEADRAADAVLSDEISVGGNLDRSTRGLMESRFGESFGDVRIHTGHRAGEAADALNSRAFTTGEDIVFGPGEFAPETTEGRRLLAHELAHVVQQRQPSGGVSTRAATEAEANHAERGVVEGGSFEVSARATPGHPQSKGKDDGEWGFSRPTSTVRGNHVFVNDRPTAYMPGAELMTSQGTSWDPAKRVYGVSVSVLSRMKAWVKYSDADAKARADNIVIVITARSEYDGHTITVTVGAHAPAKPVPPAQPPPPVPDPGTEPPSSDHTTDQPRGAAGGSGSRTSDVERKSATDPKGALKEAGDLSHEELGSLKPNSRSRLLHASADSTPGTTPPGLSGELINTTPDRDAGPLSDALQANGGRMLDDLKRNETDPAAQGTLDSAAKDLEARRQDLPPAAPDYVDWTPELAKKANEVREALKKFGSRAPDLNENMEGRPEWSGFVQKQDNDLQRELRNLDVDVKRWNSEHLADSAAGIDSAAHDEVTKALEKVHAAKTVKELFEARKVAKQALFRADQAMRAKVELDRLDSAVSSWNETQSGLAAFASVPSHALAGASFDRPNQIAAQARVDMNRAQEALSAAKTPEEMSRAATELRQIMANAHLALSMHEDEVYGGAEKTIVGIKIVGVGAAAVVAPEYVIPGILLGGGLDAARQGVQIKEGSRPDFSGEEVFDSAVTGGFIAPFAAGSTVVAGGLTGLGLLSAGNELSQGHGYTALFDATTALSPHFIKAAPDIATWARPRVAALSLRVATGLEPTGRGGTSFTSGFSTESVPELVVGTQGRSVDPITPKLTLGGGPEVQVRPESVLDPVVGKPGRSVEPITPRLPLGARPQVQVPADDYDVEAWKAYYEANPKAGRSVGAASIDDPRVAAGSQSGKKVVTDIGEDHEAISTIAPEGTVQITLGNKSTTISLNVEQANNLKLTQDLGISRNQATRILQELRTSVGRPRRTFISFAQDIGDPKAFLAKALRDPIGSWESDAFERPPSGQTRLDARIGAGKSRLSDYALVFEEEHPGQFTGKPSKTTAITEYQIVDPETKLRVSGGSVKPRAIVRVNQAGEIIEIVDHVIPGTPEEAQARLLELFAKQGWKVNLGPPAAAPGHQ